LIIVLPNTHTLSRARELLLFSEALFLALYLTQVMNRLSSRLSGMEAATRASNIAHFKRMHEPEEEGKSGTAGEAEER